MDNKDGNKEEHNGSGKDEDFDDIFEDVLIYDQNDNKKSSKEDKSISTKKEDSTKKNNDNNKKVKKNEKDTELSTDDDSSDEVLIVIEESESDVKPEKKDDFWNLEEKNKPEEEKVENVPKNKTVEDKFIQNNDEFDQQLLDMGFDLDAIDFVKYKFNGDVNMSVNYLVENGANLKKNPEYKYFHSWDGVDTLIQEIQENENNVKEIIYIPPETKKVKNVKKKKIPPPPPKKKLPKNHYRPPSWVLNDWRFNPSLQVPESEMKGKTKINDLGKDMIICIMEYLGYAEITKFASSCQVFRHLLTLNNIWSLNVLEKMNFKVRNNFIKWREYNLRKKKENSSEIEIPEKLELIQEVEAAYEKFNQPVEVVDFDKLSMKDQFTKFQKHQLINEVYKEKQRTKRLDFDNYYYKWNDSKKLIWLVLLLLFSVVTIVISLITGPLYFDGIIPLRSVFWLIPFAPPALIFPFFLIVYYLNVKNSRLNPLCTPSWFHRVTSNARFLEKMEKYNIYDDEKHYAFDIVVVIQTFLLWPFPFALSFFIKMLFFQSYHVWTFVFIPAYALLVYVSSASLITLSRERYERKNWKKYVISVTIGQLISNTLFILSGIIISLKADGYAFSSIKYVFLIIPTMVSFVVFFLSFTIPVAFEANCDTENCFFESFLPIVGPHALLLFISGPMFTTMILAALKLDSVVSFAYIICFIPVYALFLLLICVGGIVVLALCCFVAVSRWDDD